MQETPLSDILHNASVTDWTLTQDFSFHYVQNAKLTKFNIFTFVPVRETAIDIYAKSTISVEVPQLTASEMDTVLGGERRVNIRMQELFRFSVKFRDFNGLSLRKYFENIWISTQYEYPEEVNGTVYIYDKSGTLVFSSSNVVINSVSAIQFDNNSNQIAEFDVQFLSPTYSDSKVNDFGKSDYVDRYVRAEDLVDMKQEYYSNPENLR